MKLTVKNEWINALRSGRYMQGHVYLARQHSDEIHFCALGVLAEVCNTPKLKEGNLFWYQFSNLRFGHLYGLSETLRRKIRLSMTQEDELIKLNDDKKMCFTDISNWIDKNIYGD